MPRVARTRSLAPRNVSVRTSVPNRYRQIFETAQAGLWTLDAEDRVDLVHDCMAAMLGYTAAEMVGSRVFEFIEPVDFMTVQAALGRRRRGVIDKYDLRFRRKDGTLMWALVSASPIMNRNGKYAGALALVSDITDRKVGEEHLRQSEERFALLAQATGDVVYEWDVRTGRIWYSESLRDVFGYSERVSDLEWWRSRVHPDDLERMSAQVDGMKGGMTSSARGEYRFRRQDGSYADVFARGFLIRDDAGSPIRWIGAMMDFTERNAAQAAVRDSQKTLQALTSRVVHAQEDERRRIARELHDEIGQTLTAVAIGLDAVRRGALDERAVRQVEETRVAVDDALQRIREMSIGLRPLMLDDLGLPATLRWYLDGLAQKSGLAIQLSTAPAATRLCPEVEIACFRIVQEALTNVIRHAGATKVTVDVKQSSDRLSVAVTDNGRGFDVAALTSGTSLGLVGMQERARLLSGTISVVSAPGSGTTIEAVLHCPRLQE